MKKLFLKQISLLVWSFMAGTAMFAQTAQVQVIHNSADAAAASVDVYANSSLLIDDFMFRTASSFVTVPAGVPIDIGIAPSNSTDSSDAIAVFTVTFSNNGKYVVVADGIVSTTGYMPSQTFDLKVYDMARTAASNPSNVDVLVHHGSTDAPTVDVVAPFIATLVDDVAYGEFSSYLELAPNDYSIQIRNESGTDVVAEYTAPLQTLNLAGQALTVVASGFLDPSKNSNGSAFGLWVATANGGALIELPSKAISSTRAQVIHNCADLAASTVDVYLNGSILNDDFAFRTASAFVDIPAGSDIAISICPPNSTDTMSKLVSFYYNLSASSKYILVADGIVSTSGYSPIKGFNLSVYGSARETSNNPAQTDILVHHGSTDAPIVDIAEKTAGALIDNLEYAQFSNYLELPTANYTIQVKDSASAGTIAAFSAPLQTLQLEGNALTVVASGFVNPANNSNGEAFGLWVALSSGGALVELPVDNTSSLRNTTIKSALKLFPNPATDFVQFQLPNSEIAQLIQIYSSTGQLVY
ncbi:MAG: DUF4397 domain-containing protein, partial [Bacteroidia bacterium]